MSFIFRAIKIYSVLFVVAFLFSCSDKTQSFVKQSVAQVDEKKQPEIKSREITQKEVKPGAPVKLISPSIIYINPNEQTPAEILLEVKETSGELQIELSSSAELNLLDTTMQQTISLTSSSTVKIPVTLLATANGRYYLKIHVRINNGDGTSARNLAVIIQVGPVTEKTVQLKKASGEHVISLPAHETISTQ